MAFYTIRVSKRISLSVSNMFFCQTRNYAKELKIIKEESQSLRVRALNYFDDLYKTVYEDNWPSIRIALLSPNKKGVVLNNYSDTEKISNLLKIEGALNVRDLFIEQNKYLKTGYAEDSMIVTDVASKIDQIVQRKHEEDVEALYPEVTNSSDIIIDELSSQSSNAAGKLEKMFDDGSDSDSVPSDPTQDSPLAKTLVKAEYDYSRLIVPTSYGAVSSASLYEFVPATRLMGMDEYIPESAHFVNYRDSADFILNIEEEKSFSFPSHLKIYAFDRGNCSTFPPTQKGSTTMLDYYEFDLALLAPVLALDIKPEDRVLDMLSMPGVATMLILQTLTPKIFNSNALNSRGTRFILKLLGEYFPNALEHNSNILVSGQHPLQIEDTLMYNKILLCVPSYNDRLAVTDSSNFYFHPLKAKQRVRLPELQKNILKKALQLVDEGGTVLYCTQSLSPTQNEGVVTAALQELWKETSCKFVVKDMEESLHALHQFLKISKSDRCGHMVVPFLPNNYGPLYFCKIVKTLHDVNVDN